MTYVQSYDPKTLTFQRNDSKKEIVFENEKHLIHTLARYIDKNDSNDETQWTCNWINNQQLTGTDTIAYTDEDNEVVARYWRDIWFHTENGDTIDLRNFWPEVIKTVHAVDSGLIKLMKSPIKRFYWKQRGYIPTSHTYSNYRYNIRIGRLAKYATAEEYYEDEKFKVRIRPRGRDLQMKSVWWDDFGRRNSAGWKSHKFKKQWEHNVATCFAHNQNKLRKNNKKHKKNCYENSIPKGSN